jgi:hypothetical protein
MAIPAQAGAVTPGIPNPGSCTEAYPTTAAWPYGLHIGTQSISMHAFTVCNWYWTQSYANLRITIQYKSCSTCSYNDWWGGANGMYVYKAWGDPYPFTAQSHDWQLIGDSSLISCSGRPKGYTYRIKMDAGLFFTPGDEAHWQPYNYTTWYSPYQYPPAGICDLA